MPMMIRRARPTAIALAMVFVATGSVAHAASLPAHAQIGVGLRVDTATFRRTVSIRYHVEFRKVVAADIDRDGDLDVVATTDHGFTVWVNDGSGHLTSQTPFGGPALDGRSSAVTWQGDERRGDEPIQDEVPSAPLLTAYAHAPPPAVGRSAGALDIPLTFDSGHRLRSPRAPPA
jgi:hypothetical protein